MTTKSRVFWHVLTLSLSMFATYGIISCNFGMRLLIGAIGIPLITMLNYIHGRKESELPTSLKFTNTTEVSK